MGFRVGVLLFSALITLQTGSAFALNVRSADIVDGEVMNVDINADAVTTDKIMDGTVGTNDLGNLAVSNGKIADGAVSTVKLLDGAVNDAKITGPISASKISSTGLDADTVDGKHAADLAPVLHTHNQAEVTGLAASLAGKADVGHNHDNTYQKKYANIVVVAKDGGDYTELSDAMDGIIDASSSNRYLIKIMPGVFEVPAFSTYAKSYVDMEGSGTNLTKITSTSDLTGILPTLYYVDVSDCELRDLTVEHVGTYDQWGIVVLRSAVSFKNLIIAGSTGGFWFEGSGTAATLKDVRITPGAYSGIVVGQGATVKMLDGIIETPRVPPNDIAVALYGGDFRGAAVELWGRVVGSSGTSKCVSCFDMNFDPLQ